MTEEQLKEEIKGIQTSFEDENIINSEYLEELEKLRQESLDNLVSKGILYFKIANFLISYKQKFKDQKEITKKIEEIRLDSEFESSINSLLSKRYGEWAFKRRIESYVMENKKNINLLISLFFELFGETD